MKKAVVLAVACIVVVVLLVLTGAFISNVVVEKKFSDRDKDFLQAINLAEAGLNQGIVELKDAILIDLNTEVGKYKNVSTFTPYVDADIVNKDSLDFLCDFAGFSYVNGSTDEVELTFSSASLSQDALIRNLGSYSGKIIIRKQRDASGNIIEAYVDPDNPNVFHFPYEFRIQAKVKVSSKSYLYMYLTQNQDMYSADERLKFEVTVQKANFAKFALFTSHHRLGNTTVWFTKNTNFDGPVHTNERFSFANNPSGRFTSEVTQHEKKARFYNRGWPRLLDADSNPPYDVPVFEHEQGFQRGVEILNLESSITQNDLRKEALGDMSEPGTNGIYIPNDGSYVTGGIYIRGDASITMGVDTFGNSQYVINQGSTTKTVTVDYVNTQTTVTEGETSTTYNGLPDGLSNEGVIIFGSNKITSLKGTVQKDARVTVSSQDDIIITDHIRYQEYDSEPSLNAENYTNLLGILSWGGNVRVGTSAPPNLEIHSVIMAPHGIFTVDNYRWRPPSGNVTLLGGVITDFYGPFGTFSGTHQISGYGRNFIYDRRMLEGMSPPYYPTAQNFTAVAPLLNRSLKDLGLIWKQEEIFDLETGGD